MTRTIYKVNGEVVDADVVVDQLLRKIKTLEARLAVKPDAFETGAITGAINVSPSSWNDMVGVSKSAITLLWQKGRELEAQLAAVPVDAIRELYTVGVDKLWGDCISAQLLEVEDWLKTLPSNSRE